MDTPGQPTTADPLQRRPRRALLWVALVGLLVIAQSLLVVLTLRYEEARAQESTDEVASVVAADLKRRAQLLLQGVQGVAAPVTDAARWQRDAVAVMRSHRELARLERRDPTARVLDVVDSPLGTALFAHWPRQAGDLEAEIACATAGRLMLPVFSRSQFVPMANGLGVEVIDLCIPAQDAGQHVGFVVGSVVLATLLEESQPAPTVSVHELSLVEADGTRLARSGAVRGGGVFVAERVVDLPGSSLQVRVDARARRPSLIPNLAVALVLGLSAGLFAVVVMLLRDGRRRARAEEALAEALALRKAMEDSLITGVRARDRQGRTVHVNPAFCAMVGFSAQELRAADIAPYWPIEQVPVYQQRQVERLNATAGLTPAREGYETVFIRKGGERFPVIVYEAPLVDSQGQHAGWMSSVVDVSDQRRMEELTRQQQERLQATARLASVGEMASLLSHELNQPLSAIASYATGSVNLMQRPDDQTPALLLQAMTRIAEQAERAGRVIKSVHDFVRRRQQAHEVMAVDGLIESVLPLVRLQARKSGARIEIDIDQPAPTVRVDRTMVEQVLLNLTRNGLQAMEAGTLVGERLLSVRVSSEPGQVGSAGWVAFTVTDAGAGIPVEVAQRLFTPFFTTKDEGMGLGLSLCRTVIEQHGGAIDFENLVPHGTRFRFTLPLVPAMTGRVE